MDGEQSAVVEVRSLQMLPIIYSASMIQARREGRKTQTRRVFTYRHWADRIGMHEMQSVYPDGGGNWIWWTHDSPEHAAKTLAYYPNGEGVRCPYGRPGDTLWVREGHALVPASMYRHRTDIVQTSNPTNPEEVCIYRAEWEQDASAILWRSPIFLPRWAARDVSRVTHVQPGRLQAITEADALQEGCESRDAFAHVWDAIHRRAPESQWAQNPWIWAITHPYAGQTSGE